MYLQTIGYGLTEMAANEQTCDWQTYEGQTYKDALAFGRKTIEINERMQKVMKYYYAFNQHVGQFEVRGIYNNKFIAGFLSAEHAATWTRLMNGFAYIVDKEPPKIEGETE